MESSIITTRLPPDSVLYRAELYFNKVVPVVLPRRDKGAPDVFVLDKPYAVGNAGAGGISQSSVKTAVRHAYNNVRLNGMPLCQKLSRLFSRCMNAYALDIGIRTGKVDVFKRAEALSADLAALDGVNAGLVENNYLSRLDVADKARSHRTQGAAFGSRYVCSVGSYPIAERAKTVFVANCNQLWSPT